MTTSATEHPELLGKCHTLAASATREGSRLLVDQDGSSRDGGSASAAAPTGAAAQSPRLCHTVIGDDAAASARSAQQSTDDEAATRRDDLRLRRRGRRVQAIALCKKLGLTYSTSNDSPAPLWRKRLKNPPPSAVPASRISAGPSP